MIDVDFDVLVASSDVGQADVSWQQFRRFDDAGLLIPTTLLLQIGIIPQKLIGTCKTRKT